MTNEFKKLSGKSETRYVLEDGGSTTTGAIATVEKPLGELQRRAEPPKPPNFVAKNAKRGGAGKMKDKSKTIPRHEKHKNKELAEGLDPAKRTQLIRFLAKEMGWGISDLELAKDSELIYMYKKVKAGEHPVDEAGHPDEKEDKALIRQMVKHDALKKEGHGLNGYATAMSSRIQQENDPGGSEDDTGQELGMAGSELYGIAKHAKELLALIHQQGQEHGLEAWQQSKITKAADYLTAVLQSMDYDANGEQDLAEGSMDGSAIWNRYGQYTVQDLMQEFPNLSPKDAQTIVNYAEYGWTNVPNRQEYRDEVVKRVQQAMSQQGETEGAPIATTPGSINPGGAVDNFKQQMANNTELAYQKQQQSMAEGWSQKYKSAINCSHPKGFSQKAHCAGKKKHNESMMMEMVCEDCGMCKTHGNLSEIKKGAKDSNGFTKCWPGKHAVGTKKGKNGGQVRNCKPNEDIEEGDAYMEALSQKLAEKIPKGASVDYYIKDFAKSTAPQFKNKNPAKRKQMAIAAWNDSKRKK